MTLFGIPIDYVALGEIALAFILKLLDNSLGTAKTIYIAKGKYFLGSLFNGVGTLFYLIAIVRIAKTSNMAGIIAMCIATFVGTLLPCLIIKKSEPERLFVFDITADSLDNGKIFADALRNKNIPVRTYFTYDKHMNKTLACNVYCSTKEESKTVEELLQPGFRWNTYVPLEQ